jgi:hypothetical protein
MYNLEISAPGYEAKIIWTELAPGKDKTITVDLQTGKVSEAKTKPSVTDDQGRHLAKRFERSKDEQELADIPKKMSGQRVSLRTEPKKLSDRDIKKMLARYDFYDDELNLSGSFANDFVDNGNGTITDKSTGLMWQKSGSSGAKTWKQAQKYVNGLNKNVFAGYANWRLPTIEELASLVEREKVDGVHIDPIFYDKQKSCWSADTKLTNVTNEGYTSWIVKFSDGIVIRERWSSSKVTLSFHVHLEGRWYVRAVRSVK